jgi:hypothetical protein
MLFSCILPWTEQELHWALKKNKMFCETQMPLRRTNSIDSHAYVKAFEK